MGSPHGDGHIEGVVPKQQGFAFHHSTVVDSQAGIDHPAFQAGKLDTSGMQHFADPSQFLRLLDVAARRPSIGSSDQSSLKVGNEANDFGGAASPEFNGRVQKLVDKLPKEYQDFIKKYHIPITTAERADTKGDLGSFNAKNDKITIPEDQLKGKSDEEISTTLRHELAHAYDKQFGISGNGVFSYAASKDFYAQQQMNLTPEERKRLDFYNDPHNRVELFAELFAQLKGGTPEQAARARLLFPNASDWIDKNAKWPDDKGKK